MSISPSGVQETRCGILMNLCVRVHSCKLCRMAVATLFRAIAFQHWGTSVHPQSTHSMSSRESVSRDPEIVRIVLTCNHD
jgi:hypothetical protein